MLEGAAVFVGMTSLGSCSSFELDATSSTGSGGRDWVTAEWTVNSTTLPQKKKDKLLQNQKKKVKLRSTARAHERRKSVSKINAFKQSNSKVVAVMNDDEAELSSADPPRQDRDAAQIADDLALEMLAGRAPEMYTTTSSSRNLLAEKEVSDSFRRNVFEKLGAPKKYITKRGRKLGDALSELTLIIIRVRSSLPRRLWMVKNGAWIH